MADLELARAAKHVIITTERLDPQRRDPPRPHRTFIPYYCVDAVVEVPYGSYPGNMPYEYFSDEEHLREWLDGREGPGRRSGASWTSTSTACSDFDEYLELCGGLKRLHGAARPGADELGEREGTADGGPTTRWS